MAYKIATYSWKDLNEEEYFADIYSKATNITTINFQKVTSAIGEWESASDDYVDFIMTYKFTLSFLVNDATEENLLSVIISAPENDIYVHFYTASKTLFKGYILPEMMSIDNAPFPYEMHLTFTDGIGKLAELKYTDFGYGSTSYMPAVNYFIFAFRKLALEDLYDAADTYLITRPGFFPQGVTLPGNYNEPWSASGISIHYATDNYDKYILPVLAELCRLFHTRLMYRDGVYVLDNLDQRVNTSVREHHYKDLSLLGEDYVSPALTPVNPTTNIDNVDHIISSGEINFLPGVKVVDLYFSFKNESGRKISILTPYKWDDDHLTAMTDIEIIHKKSLTKLHFEFEYHYKFESGAFASTRTPLRVMQKITIRVGTKYLKMDVKEFTMQDGPVYEDPTWEDTVHSVYVYSKMFKFPHSDILDITPIYMIDAPVIPASGMLSINSEYIDLVESDNTPVNEPTWLDVLEYENINNYLAVGGEKDDDTNDILYSSINSEANLKTLKFEGSILDLPNSNSHAKIILYTVPLSEPTGWYVNVGDVMSIQRLMINSAMQFRQSIRKLHHMNLIHKSDYPNPDQVMVYDSQKYYIFSQVFDYRMAYSEEMVLFQLVKGTIPLVIHKKKNTKPRGWIGLLNAETERRSLGGGNPPTKHFIIETTDAVSSGAILTIPINAMVGNYFEGDYFEIITPTDNTKKDLLMLTGDCLDEATTMDVTGTLTRDYPKGSQILMKPRPEYHYYVLNNPTTEVSVPTGDLPDTSKLSLNAVRRKTIVMNQGVGMKVVLPADLQNYNDVAVDAVNDKLIFHNDQSDNFITIKYEPWQDLL